MSEVKETGVPNIYLSDLEKLTSKIRSVTDDDKTEVSFELIIGSLFPTSWANIQDAISYNYTQGYIQGRADAEKELSAEKVLSHSVDADCYCE